MGAWGTAIFSDDYTADIKREYQALISCGVPMKEALDKTIEYFQVNVSDDPRFWFAIASIQCKYNILDDEVRAVTLEILNNGGDLDEWENDNAAKRRKVLSDLQKKLLDYDISKPPLKVPKPRIHKAKWKPGDVLSCRLINYPNYLYYKFYIGMQLVYIEKTPISHIMPELIYDEWMHMVLFDYIGEEKPNFEQLISCGYKQLIDNRNGKQVQDLIFSYHPYRGKIEDFDNRKTATMLYDIDVLGNQEHINYKIDEEKLAGCSYMYDNLEEVISRFSLFE